MINVSVDMTEFNRTFSAYMAQTKKSLATVLNTKMAMILKMAIYKTTKKVSASQIKAELRAGTPSLAEKLVWKRVKARRETITKKEAKERAKKLIASRVRSSGFVLSGWIAALKKVLPYSAMKSVTVPRQRGKDKGGSKPAPLTGGINISSEAWNLVTGSPPDSKVSGVKNSGIALALAAEMASMQAYLEKKWKADTAKFFHK